MWPDLATMAPDRRFPAIGSGREVPNLAVGSSRETPNSMLPAARSGWILVECCRKGLDRCFSTIFGRYRHRRRRCHSSHFRWCEWMGSFKVLLINQGVYTVGNKTNCGPNLMPKPLDQQNYNALDVM
ncbi:Uncharacterized protein TCM_008241 [Theobroma cacao]|uniref:Uncharacterized protein n=1 Tax=Theobroma cacao TaxID=3641 RepID=A0A061E4I4_THECC|nr:Uncharacterized protein TCM_008241 [Theobroma cacao]